MTNAKVWKSEHYFVVSNWSIVTLPPNTNDSFTAEFDMYRYIILSDNFKASLIIDKLL